MLESDYLDKSGVTTGHHGSLFISICFEVSSHIGMLLNGADTSSQKNNTYSSMYTCTSSRYELKYKGKIDSEKEKIEAEIKSTVRYPRSSKIGNNA